MKLCQKHFFMYKKEEEEEEKPHLEIWFRSGAIVPHISNKNRRWVVWIINGPYRHNCPNYPTLLQVHALEEIALLVYLPLGGAVLPSRLCPNRLSQFTSLRTQGSSRMLYFPLCPILTLSQHSLFKGAPSTTFELSSRWRWILVSCLRVCVHQLSYS